MKPSLPKTELPRLTRFPRFVFQAFLFLCAGLLGVATATEVVPLSLDETLRQADAVLLGTATSKQTRWGDSTHRWMVTDYTFSVEDALYTSSSGRNIGNIVVLTYWGGTLDGETQAISDLRPPQIGERLVMMLRPGWQEGGFTPVVGFNQGLFVVSSESPGGPALVRSDTGQNLTLTAQGQVMRPGGNAVEGSKTNHVDLAAFRTWLKANVSAIKAKPSEDKLPAAVVDPRVIKPFAKTPESLASRTGSANRGRVVNRQPLSVSAAEQPAPPASGMPAVTASPAEGSDQTGQAPQKFSSQHQAHLPIVVNNFPDNFDPWSPEDEYQMSKWNYYASDVFRVYATPTGTYGWGNGRFDLAGWPSSADLQSTYGSPWGATTLGVTFLRYDSGGWIIEADIALNPAYSWTLDDEWVYEGGPAKCYRRTMTHELGHMHGLEHQFNYLSVMDYPPSVFRALSMPFMDDAAGIRAEYPGNAVSLTDLGVHLFYSSGYQSWTDATMPASVVAGNSLTVNNYQIENVGTTTIGTPTIEWYLTAARNFGSSYYYLGSSTHSSLAPFTYFTPSSVQRTFTVPANVPPGNYYLGAFIRNDNSPGQSSFPFDNNRAFSRGQIAVTSPAPANDNWVNAIGLPTPPTSTTGNNFGATTEPNEQQLSPAAASVWWYILAPANGTMTIDTFGSDFDTMLHIYTGYENGFANLIPVTNNDDTGGWQSQVTFPVTAGQYYEIRVAGYGGAQGNVQLHVGSAVGGSPDIRITPLDLSFTAANLPPAPAKLALPALPRLVGMTASPHDIHELQPDGTPIVLNIRGGVDFHWLEDAAGYTVVQDGKAFVYAQLDAAGRLAPTALLVGKTTPGAAGLLPRTLPNLETRQQMAAERIAAGPAAIPSTATLPVGTVKNVVILMRFANHTSRTLPSNANMSTIFNAVGGDSALAPSGSVRDLYLENSYGAMVLNSTVYGWVTLPKTEQYYANGQSGDSTVWEAITAALNLTDALIDYNQFDADGDNWVDAISFIHSGYGAEWGGTDADGVSYANRIWSHRWQIPTWTSAEGVRVRDYHISPGLWGTSGTAPGRIGVICHETGHFFGLPDLYDTDGGGEGIGSYCMMANSWGFTGSQLNPPHFSAWAKISLGWVTPTLLNSPGNYSLPRAETSPTVFKISNGYPSGEYLLVENRQPFGFESTMPQGGLAVWHIDENKSGNTGDGYPGQAGWPGNNQHYKVALLQADGLFNLEHGNNRGDAGDVFHGAGVSQISHSTTPNTDAYQNGTVINTGNRIYNISGAGATMTFSFATSGGSTAQGFEVFNDGNANLTVSAITPDASAPWISSTPAAPFTLTPGASQFVTVTVNPTLAPEGTTTTRLLVVSDDSDESPYPGGVQINVTRIIPASIAVGPASQNFGSIALGTSSDRTFYVTNSGGSTLSGTASVATPFSIVSGGSYTLTANQWQSVVVRYTPTSIGNANQSVTFTGGGGAQVAVSGSAFNPPDTTPPTVSITSPASALPLVSSSLVVAGTASDPGYPSSGVALVQVRLNGGSWQTASGTANWTSPLTLAAGNNVIAARSRDVAGNYSAIMTVTVVYTPDSTPHQLTGMSVSDGTARFVLNGPSGGTYVIQASSNLIDWMPISTNTIPADGSLLITDPTKADKPCRFYRAVLQATSSAIHIPAASGVITSPFIVTNGFIYQPSATSLANSGRAAYNFTIVNAGTYELQVLVNAPNEGANSLFLNIDAEPQDPYMISDIPVTSGFAQRTLSWRGNGTVNANEFVPKVFTLASGTHQLVIRGREASTMLQSITIVPRP